MKTPDEIQAARKTVKATVMQASRLSDVQLSLFMGMSVALQWVSGDGGATLQRLLDGEPVEAGKDIRAAMERLRSQLGQLGKVQGEETS